MADTVVLIPGVGNVAFPSSMTPAQINAAAAKLYAESQPKPARVQSPGGAERHNNLPSPLDAAAEQIETAEAARLKTNAGILPMVGGVLGSVGGPIGAVLGGVGGEAARQSITGESSVRGIAEQGAIQGGIEALGGAVTRGLHGGARAVYRGYLKPSLAQSKVAKANEIVETAISEALPIARAGTEKAQRFIGALRAEVTNVLKQSGEMVDLHAVAERVRGFAKRRYFRPGADSADYKAALDVANSIDQHASLGLPPGAKPSRVDVPLSKADDTKRAIDTSIGDASFGVTRGATKTTQKMARHEIRKDLEKKAPSIAPLNARESKLIDAARAIRQAVEREANQNQVYGVKTMASGALGTSAYAAGVGDPLTVLAGTLATRFALQPQVASRAAIIADRLSRELGVSSGMAARVAVHVVSEQGEDEVPPQRADE